MDLDGTTYAVTQSGSLWRQSGQELLSTSVRCPFENLGQGLGDALCGPFFDSLPWKKFDFSAENEGWMVFSADTTLADELTTFSYSATKQSLGRTSVVTPAGIFHDVHSTSTRSEVYSTYVIAEFWHSQDREVMAVADSVGIVQWSESSTLRTSLPGLSSSVVTDFRLVAYGKRGNDPGGEK